MIDDEVSQQFDQDAEILLIVCCCGMYLNALSSCPFEKVVEGSLGRGEEREARSARTEQLDSNRSSLLDPSKEDRQLTTTTTLFPSLWTCTPPIVHPCWPSTSLTSTTPLVGSRRVTIFSSPYFSLYRAWISEYRSSLLSGIEAVERIPANQGPTEGTNASLNAPEGDSLDRWCDASRSWMWSVNE